MFLPFHDKGIARVRGAMDIILSQGGQRLYGAQEVGELHELTIEWDLLGTLQLFLLLFL